MKKEKQKQKQKELLIEQISKLREMKLPEKWKVARLDVEFKREGFGDAWGVVCYDSTHDTFYFKGNRGMFMYPSDIQVVNEGIEIIREANKIIGSKKKEAPDYENE